MEIERKWLVNGWPKGDYPVVRSQDMEQGYLSVVPSVRIRREAEDGSKTVYLLTLKKGSGLVRHEVEVAISKTHYEELREMIGLPMVKKLRRTYLLPDGCRLEVNLVEEGTPDELWYAEIEYETEAAALAWKGDVFFPDGYLDREVTREPKQTMSAYWSRTRLGEKP